MRSASVEAVEKVYAYFGADEACNVRLRVRPHVGRAFTTVCQVTTPNALPPLVVVSNRGPLAFKVNDDGERVPTRAGGGLVASLAPAIQHLGATWIAAEVVESSDVLASDPNELDGIIVRNLAIERSRYRQYYDVIANGTLWFMHHNLFDLARRPYIDQHWWDAWEVYREVNFEFAREVAAVAPENAVVLVHDYHLTLLGKWLRDNRPDLKTVHFHHTPFAGRNSVRILPPKVVQEVLEGLAGHDVCGFHSQRWADSYAMACNDHLEYEPKTFVSAAGTDVTELLQVAMSPECQEAKVGLVAMAGDRKLIVRVDRIELSKNLLRGFHAYDDFLDRHPEWHERVVFAAFVYPSREGLAEYLAYRNEVEALVARINTKWAKPGWTPIELHLGDDFPQSVAALLRYDVLLVNPIRDGLNLVAKEGAVVNERDGAIVLSLEAGSWHELEAGAIGINPFDIVGTSDALLEALEMSDEKRKERAAILRAAATAHTPQDWLADQLAAVGVFG